MISADVDVSVFLLANGLTIASPEYQALFIICDCTVQYFSRFQREYQTNDATRLTFFQLKCLLHPLISGRSSGPQRTQTFSRSSLPFSSGLLLWYPTQARRRCAATCRTEGKRHNSRYLPQVQCVFPSREEQYIIFSYTKRKSKEI